jgi:hypothetical protein
MQINDEDESCPFCGWKPGRYIRFDAYLHRIKSEEKVPGTPDGEAKFKDRIYIRRLRLISQMKPKDRLMYLRVMKFLKMNRDKAFSAFELRQLFEEDIRLKRIEDTRGMTKVLRLMVKQGMVQAGRHFTDVYYAWKVSGEW